jgi:hypothetical protein
VEVTVSGFDSELLCVTLSFIRLGFIGQSLASL